jgi:hypothetical protein
MVMPHAYQKASHTLLGSTTVRMVLVPVTAVPCGRSLAGFVRETALVTLYY